MWLFVRLLVAAVLASLLGACGAGPRLVEVAPGTTLDQRMTVSAALMAWNEVARAELGYDVFVPGEGDVTIWFGVGARGLHCKASSLGCAHVGGSDVWLEWDRMYEAERFPVAVHELGHVLGLRDREGSDGIMADFMTDLAVEFSLTDRTNLRLASEGRE